MDGPRLHFCLVKREVPTDKQKVYEQYLTMAKAYHEQYGKDGFLSERTYEDTLERTARKNAEAACSAAEYNVMAVPFLSNAAFESGKSNFEASIKNFVRWLK